MMLNQTILKVLLGSYFMSLSQKEQIASGIIYVMDSIRFVKIKESKISLSDQDSQMKVK
jgi:hypothetical protein